MRKHQWMITAAAVHAYNTQTSMGCVRDCFQACAKALEVNDIAATPGTLRDVVRQVTALERTTALRKVAAFDIDEVDDFAKNWGRYDQPLNRRQTSLIVEWGFERLLRFADAAVLNTFFIYWMGKDFAFKLPSRKNDQMATKPWQMVAHTGENCLAARVRRFILDTNPGAVIPKWGFATINGQILRRFVFRETGPMPGKACGCNHEAKMVKHGCGDVLIGDGELPISCHKNRKPYKKILQHVRNGLRQLRGYTKKQADTFGMQALRRGGDTHLWKCKVPQEIRMAMGGWKTPSVELEYLETSMEEQRAFSLEIWSTRRGTKRAP